MPCKAGWTLLLATFWNSVLRPCSFIWQRVVDEGAKSSYTSICEMFPVSSIASMSRGVCYAHVALIFVFGLSTVANNFTGPICVLVGGFAGNVIPIDAQVLCLKGLHVLITCGKLATKAAAYRKGQQWCIRLVFCNRSKVYKNF